MKKWQAWGIALFLVLIVGPAVNIGLRLMIGYDATTSTLIGMPIGFLFGITGFMILVKNEAL